MNTKKENNNKTFLIVAISIILIVGFIALLCYAIVDGYQPPFETSTIIDDNTSMYLKFEDSEMSGFEITDDEGNIINEGDGQAPIEFDNGQKITDSDEEGISYYDEDGNVVYFQEGEFEFYDSEGELLE